MTPQQKDQLALFIASSATAAIVQITYWFTLGHFMSWFVLAMVFIIVSFGVGVIDEIIKSSRRK